MPDTDRPQLTTLLSNTVMDRLERLRLNARGRRTNRSRGEHLAGKGGTSTEFCDYRDYSPGDDTRFVDWNIFARLHRPYLKQFHQEAERHVVLVVDASTSMLSEGKLERAQQLATACGVLGLRNHEKVSVYVAHQRGAAPQRLAPCTGRVSLRKFFGFMEGIAGGGDAPIEEAISQLLKLHRGRGVCVVLSDFLTFGDLTRSFNMLYATGLEVWGLQLLGPSERDPEVTGDLRFVDAETQDHLDVSAAADLVGYYQEYRAAFEAQLARFCQRRAGRFLSVSSETPVETLLFDELRRRGWLG